MFYLLKMNTLIELQAKNIIKSLWFSLQFMWFLRPFYVVFTTFFVVFTTFFVVFLWLVFGDLLKPF